MSELNQSGNTTSSTGNTATFNYGRQNVSTSTTKSKVIELPTFKTMPIVKAFEEIQDTINNQKNIFGDLLTEGDLTILFGRSNVGKSFLSYQIAEAVAKGVNVLNIMDIEPLRNYGETKYSNLNNETQAQKVLYVDFEATIEKNYIRYSNKDLRRENKEVLPFQFSHNFLTAFPNKLTIVDNLLFIDAIELEIIKTGVKMVIIDNLSAISQDNEKSGQAVKLMNRIKDLQRKYKLSLLLMAHTPKIFPGEPIISNNLQGSSILFSLADSVFAINTTTTDDSIRYIKQLKSRYNEIIYNQDNVIAVKFDLRLDGLKGFSFLGYESESELLKSIDKTTKQDEDREIINLIKHFGYSVAQVAEELKPKFAPDTEFNTYYQRIKKRIQRLKAKGLLNDSDTENNIPLILPTVKPSQQPETLPKKVMPLPQVKQQPEKTEHEGKDDMLNIHTLKSPTKTIPKIPETGTAEEDSLLKRETLAAFEQNQIIRQTHTPEIQDILDRQSTKDRAEELQDLADLRADLKKITSFNSTQSV